MTKTPAPNEAHSSETAPDFRPIARKLMTTVNASYGLDYSPQQLADKILEQHVTDEVDGAVFAFFTEVRPELREAFVREMNLDVETVRKLAARIEELAGFPVPPLPPTVPPQTGGHRQPYAHEVSDRLSLLHARRHADLILSDPTLISRALNRLERQQLQNAATRLWRFVLRRRPMEVVIGLLLEDSARGRELRGGNPFNLVAPMQSETERRALYRQAKREAVTSCITGGDDRGPEPSC